MSKLKVLLSAEYSALGTGYGGIYKNLGKAFMKAGFDVTEYASYCFQDDMTRFASDWPIIPAGPDRSNQKAMEEYNGNFFNQFGAYFFDQAIANIKPDIVVDVRDPWYCFHIVSSPSRKFFNWIYQPTIDSRPQRPEWVWAMENADILNTYSYFGKETITQEYGLKHDSVTPPCVEDSFFTMYDNFQGKNKDVFRQKYGMPKKAFIMSFVSRNQRRKLMPDIIYSVDKLISEIKEDVPIYVHFHTSYPDQPAGSWEFPLYLSRVKHPERFLFTYLCNRCKNTFVRTFADGIVNCPRCQGAAMMPGPGTGFVDRSVQSEIMYAADAGLLIAIGEGYGMSGPEFKALGIPLITTEWSATKEQGMMSDGTIPRYPYENGDLTYLGGQCVKNGYLWIEPESGQFRSYPDREDLIKKIFDWYKLYTNDKNKWQELQKDAFRSANSTYRWEKTTSRYIEQILKLGSTQSRYALPKRAINPDGIMQQLIKVPIKDRVDAWYSVVSKFMLVPPHILIKTKADALHLSTFGMTSQSKVPVSFTDINKIHDFMYGSLKKVESFENIR